MEGSHQVFQFGKKERCHDWALGKCPHGANCIREHHPNLDAALRSTREHDYDVPNTQGGACMGCMQHSRPCDKNSRPGDDDPCSECRWFGGPSVICSLNKESSYNDVLWVQMLQREKYDYTLPAPKKRDAPRGRLPKPPTPMPDNRVKRTWTGETKDDLLAKPDMLPDYVRQLPRAYLVPPRPSWQKQKKDKKTENYKRKFETQHNSPGPAASSTSNTPRSLWPPSMAPSTFNTPRVPGPLSTALATSTAMASSMPQYPDLSSFPQPPADAQHGEVVSSNWLWGESKWAHIYASGFRVVGPTLSAPTESTPSRPWHSRYEDTLSGSEPLMKKLRPQPSVSTSSAVSTEQPSVSQIQDRSQQDLSTSMAVDSVDPDVQAAFEDIGDDGLGPDVGFEYHSGDDSS